MTLKLNDGVSIAVIVALVLLLVIVGRWVFTPPALAKDKPNVTPFEALERKQKPA